MSEKMELKPCPFCGGEAKFSDVIRGIIYCGGEECFGPRTTALTEQDSIVQWNTRASSPALEPVTTEPVAWTNEAQLGFLKEPGYRVVPMAMWAFQHSAHPIALYTIPAPPQPGRAWLPIVGMEWPTEPVLLGFWYQGEFKQYIGMHAPEGWVAGWMESPRQYFPDHIQAWFTHWRPLPAPPTLTGEPK